MRLVDTSFRNGVSRIVPVVLAVLVLGVRPALLVPQMPVPSGALPFAVGEKLTYRVQVGKLGTVGHGSLQVEGPEQVRDRETYLLHFDFRTRVGLVSVRDRTESWLDPKTMSSLRFVKEEHYPLGGGDQDVQLFPEERRWQDAQGKAGSSPTDQPLDELSFIYFIRTLPLKDGDVYEFTRHFEPGRNPVTVQVLGRSTLSVPAGSFATVLVEMRVKDPGRFHGEGVIRLYLTDDGCHIPVRIETALPAFGTMVLSLES